MSEFRIYYYSLLDEPGETYHAQFTIDFAARSFLERIYGKNLGKVWNDDSTIYHHGQDSQMPEVQPKRRRRARQRAGR